MDVSIKICGLTRVVDARAAEAAGATYGGVILAPDSPRTVRPAAVPAVFAGSRLIRCGVFVDEGLPRISELVDALDLGVVQLHGDESPDGAAAIRAATGVEVWKAIRPRDGDEFAREADRFAGSVDGLLLDGWSARARGGTGTPFPWSEVARRREELDPALRLIVAGGLTPTNVARVVRLLAPDVVDVASGVERSPGVKNSELIRRFADAVHGVGSSGDSIDGSTRHR